jgi:hypothetical protein
MCRVELNPSFYFFSFSLESRRCRDPAEGLEPPTPIFYVPLFRHLPFLLLIVANVASYRADSIRTAGVDSEGGRSQIVMEIT